MTMHEKSSPWAHCVHVPIFDKQEAAGVDAATVAAIRSYVKPYYAGEGVNLGSFKNRLALFEEFLDSCGVVVS